MTQPDAMELLRTKCEETSQAEVGRRIGYSSGAICGVLKGTYKGDTDKVLQAVVEVYGGLSVACPFYRTDIPLSQCAAERRRPFAATNSQRVELWLACRKCEQEGKQ